MVTFILNLKLKTNYIMVETSFKILVITRTTKLTNCLLSSNWSVPPFPLFVYTSLNPVKQNVDLTGFCYILLSIVKPRKLN